MLYFILYLFCAILSSALYMYAFCDYWLEPNQIAIIQLGIFVPVINAIVPVLFLFFFTWDCINWVWSKVERQ